MKNKRFLKDFLMVLSSNFLGLLLSVAMNLLIPILFAEDLSSYGYIQLYLLYAGYYYLFTLGACNGIYLKEGGNNFDSLDKGLYSAQFIVMTAWQVLLGILLGLGVVFFCNDANKQVVLFFATIGIVILSVREMLSVIFQATSKMKEYSIVTILSKLMSVLTILLAFVFGIKYYPALLCGFVFGESMVLLYALIASRKLIFSKPTGFKIAIKEVGRNIASGYTILVSGLTAMLITGFAKLCVENHWGITTFSKLSFTISLANLFIVFANAASVVLYPRLRNIGTEQCNSSYKKVNKLIVSLLFLGIGFCYPAKLLLQSFLPEYRESLVYISILLPMCVFIGKTTMATQTYMKALRLEKQLMISNLVSFAVSAALVFVAVYILNDITLTVFSILIGQILRAVFCEIFLSRTIRISVVQNTLIECLITACFVVTHWIIGGWLGSAIYMAAVLAYLAFVFITTRMHKGKVEDGE